MYQSELMEDYELLSDLVGAQNASIILEEIGLGDLDGTGEGRLKQLGVTEIGAIRILAALELSKRVSEDVARSHPIECSKDVFDLYRAGLATLKQEQFIAVLVNTKNQVIGEKTISIGTSNECAVNPKDVFHFAVQESATRIFVVHNHPSGDCTPSPQDIALTKRLNDGAELLGITLLDHIIIGRSSYSSLRDLGILATIGAYKEKKEKKPKKKGSKKKKLKVADSKPEKKIASKKARKKETMTEFLKSRNLSPPSS